LRAALGPRRLRPEAVFVAGALIGLPLSAAISMGEARYRVPFDGIFIALASAVYAGAANWSDLDQRPRQNRYGTRRWALSGLGLGSVIVVLLAAVHPRFQLGAALRARGESSLARGGIEHGDLARFAVVRPEGVAWNAPGNYLFVCAPGCSELRFELAAGARARALSVSVDHNDRYRLRFYRGGKVIARADLAPYPQVVGLHSTQIEVPAAALAGFDARL
jgi:hypothetical protein